jgi:hypothetical protein
MMKACLSLLMCCRNISIIHFTAILSTTQRIGVATRCTLLGVFANMVATVEDGFWVVHMSSIFKPFIMYISQKII